MLRKCSIYYAAEGEEECIPAFREETFPPELERVIKDPFSLTIWSQWPFHWKCPPSQLFLVPLHKMSDLEGSFSTATLERLICFGFNLTSWLTFQFVEREKADNNFSIICNWWDRYLCKIFCDKTYILGNFFFKTGVKLSIPRPTSRHREIFKWLLLLTQTFSCALLQWI